MARLLRHTAITEIVGDILRLSLPPLAENAPATSGSLRPRLEDMALVYDANGENPRLAQVTQMEEAVVSLQVYGGTKGISTHSMVSFLGEAMRVTCSENILGRVFSGAGQVVDGGPALDDDAKTMIGTPSVNPMKRSLASKMIRTNLPMIDVFNCLVESQKIPIFSVAGEPYNALLARIAVEADADIVIFGGMGLIFDDVHLFRRAFEDAGVIARTVMFVNQASDPVLERLLVPDMALAVAERFAVDQGKRVLVLLTDMTAFADALKEVGIAMEKVPAARGYTGDLYSQLARRYEKACDYQGAGSVTILSVTTMPGDDVTHPVPDNTGYITEGQFYLHGGVIDPFGSLSRLKQHVIGKETREDHGAVMNTMIRFYAAARDAAQKQSMAFELSEYDERLLTFGALFRERFMNLSVVLKLEEALDLCWQTMAECFSPEELLMKKDLVEKYLPKQTPKEKAGADVKAAA